MKYYRDFAEKSREECIRAMEEDFTPKAKQTRVIHAQRIFREGRQREALELIARSARVDELTAKRAQELLRQL